MEYWKTSYIHDEIEEYFGRVPAISAGRRGLIETLKELCRESCVTDIVTRHNKGFLCALFVAYRNKNGVQKHCVYYSSTDCQPFDIRMLHHNVLSKDKRLINYMDVNYKNAV